MKDLELHDISFGGELDDDNDIIIKVESDWHCIKRYIDEVEALRIITHLSKVFELGEYS